LSKGNTFENDLLLLIFNNTDAALIGDATGLRGSSTAGSLYVSLHTSNPDETGTQVTGECNYGSYDRVAVVRSGSGWTVSANAVTNAALIQFPQCTSGSNTVTHFAVGTTAYSGTGKILYKGSLSAPLSVSSGIQPQFAAGDLDITED
jgi:hypothetical protein